MSKDFTWKRWKVYLIVFLAVGFIIVWGIFVLHREMERTVQKETLAVIWSQVDNNHPNQIMASFEKPGNYLDVRQVADEAVRSWYKENPTKKVTATSITVILNTADE